jgi:hypothetical protein
MMKLLTIDFKLTLNILKKRLSLYVLCVVSINISPCKDLSALNDLVEAFIKKLQLSDWILLLGDKSLYNVIKF